MPFGFWVDIFRFLLSNCERSMLLQVVDDYLTLLLLLSYLQVGNKDNDKDVDPQDDEDLQDDHDDDPENELQDDALDVDLIEDFDDEDQP